MVLWFAWKIVLLQYRKQLLRDDKLKEICCDLLEKSYFCSIANNYSFRCGNIPMLWFAWKIVLLQYRKQLKLALLRHTRGCDLLEKSYFCSIANNFLKELPTRTSVVICLKNRTFAVSQTTLFYWYSCSYQLWFAWKIVLLQYRKQHEVHRPPLFCVVICLKNRTFAVSQTTIALGISVAFRLWFAWKIVLLQYRKQHNLQNALARLSCDLLEKSYFCSIANNRSVQIVPIFRLWFAWKIVLLQYRKQPVSWLPL